MAQQRPQWGSRMGFILAAAGSAVGLGNIWRFPYTTGENGGGLFVLVYLMCIVLIGLPILMSEIMIGRAAQKQPVGAFATIEGRRTAWSGIGWLGVLAGFIILSYYAVVAGWAMDYTLKSVVNFSGSMSQQARAEGLKYRAEASLEDMKLLLIDDEYQRIVPDREQAIIREVRPSSWRSYQELQAVITNAPDPAAAEAALLEDPVRRRQVEEAHAIVPRLDDVRSAARAELVAKYDNMTPLEIRQQAEDLVRRNALREQIGQAFGAVAGDGWITTFWTALFMLLTILIVAGGISSGIERACSILMPALFILMMLLVLYGMFMPGFTQAASFVFKPSLHELRPSSVLGAMGQAFFSLSLGMGAMITYGSYQRSKEGLAGQSAAIAAMDTGVALLACLMVFPIVFSFGQPPSAGPGLVFMSMPLAFAEIGTGGMLIGTAFFGLLVFAALTSSISLLEVVASYFIDERGWSRTKSVWVLGGSIFLLSLASAFASDSQSLLAGWQSSYGQQFDFLTTMDYVASNWMLPVGGFFIAIYAGWVMPQHVREAETTGLAPTLALGWLLLVRFVAPATVILILMQSIGILDADELLFDWLHAGGQ